MAWVQAPHSLRHPGDVTGGFDGMHGGSASLFCNAGQEMLYWRYPWQAESQYSGTELSAVAISNLKGSGHVSGTNTVKGVSA
jgi:hypothetical protein